MNCSKCSKIYQNKKTFKKHPCERIVSDYKCDFCNKSFSRSDNVTRHKKICVLKPKPNNDPIPSTSRSIPNNDLIPSTSRGIKRTSKETEISGTKQKSRKILDEEEIEEVKKIVDDMDDEEFSNFYSSDFTESQLKSFCSRKLPNVKVKDSCYGTNFIRFAITNSVKTVNIEEYVDGCEDTALKLVNKLLEKKESLKIQLSLQVKYIKPEAGNKPQADLPTKIRNHPAKFDEIDEGSDWRQVFDDQKLQILKHHDGCHHIGSFWSVQSIIELSLTILKYSPLKGGSYVKTPSQLYKKGLVNIQNVTDNLCFAFSILAQIHPCFEHRERPSNYYRHLKDLKLEGLDFPLKLCDIKKFEKLNPKISVNVFRCYGKYKVVNLTRKTQLRKETHVNLLLLEEYGKQHFVLITDLLKLVRPQISKHKGLMLMCEQCFCVFHKEEAFKKHSEKGHCIEKIVKFPSSGKEKLKFDSYRKGIDLKFAIYADFECLLEKANETRDDSSENIEVLQNHIPSSYGYLIKTSSHSENDDKIKDLRLYRGSDCAQHFVESIRRDAIYIHNTYLSVENPMIMTSDDKLKFDDAKNCAHCCKTFDDETNKNRDHCHHTGKYRQALCCKCNLEFKEPSFIPVLFHNMNYDAHCFMKAFAQLGFRDDSFKVLGKTDEKYISFSCFIRDGNIGSKQKSIELRFLDSYRFLNASLATVADTLPKADFKILIKHFQETNDPTKHELLLGKQFYPYSWFDSFSKYDESQFPDKKHFFNDLTQTDILDEDYVHAKKVYEKFNCANMGEYTDLYLKTDILILADVMEHQRAISLDVFNLDPLHYFGAPSLSWACMLKQTGVELDLLTDHQMFEFVRNGIRGGIVQCIKKKSVANHEDLESYNKNEPIREIIYIDCNNLYGKSLSSHLPTGGFEWINDKELGDDLEKTLKFVKTVEDNADVGYLLEIDISYSNTPECHQFFSDYPILAEKKKSPIGKHVKLICDLTEKKNYIISYQMLKRALQLGLLVTKIHRILKFNQSNFMEQYVSFNTKKRTEATNSYAKDYYKLMVNSVFGKTLENQIKFREFRIVNKWGYDDNTRKLCAQHLIADPKFKDIHHIEGELCCIELDVLEITINRPVYVGLFVLETSKCIMIDFFYNFLKPAIENYKSDDGGKANMRLLYTDTDSYILEINNVRFHELIRDFVKDYFDTSDYDPNFRNKHNLESLNKKILGMFKIETFGFPIKIYIGIGPKSYAYEVDGDVCTKHKGLKQAVVKKFTMENYARELENFLHRLSDVEESENTEYHKQFRIRYKDNQIETIRETKKGLYINDDKRFTARDDCLDSLPHGHCNIKQDDLDYYLKLM